MNEMSDPLFSVIVPTYNNEREIRRCIESILCQTYRNFELILIDDGSQDLTSLYCDQFSEKDDRVKVVHKENAGAAAARNTGLFLAKGRYIYFVDADDWVDNTLLYEASQVLDKVSAPDIFVFGSRMLMENQTVTYSSFVEPGLYTKSRLEHEVYSRMMCPRGKKDWMSVVSYYLWDKIISRELLLEHYCRDTSLFMGEESVCAYECMYYAKEVFFSPLILYTYDRTSISSMHRRYHEDLFTNCIRVEEYYRTYLSKGNEKIESQINREECRSLRYVIDYELEFNKSVYWSSIHLKKKMEQVKTYLICPLKGLSFADKCFVLVFSMRQPYLILVFRKLLIMMARLWRKLKERCCRG